MKWSYVISTHMLCNHFSARNGLSMKVWKGSFSGCWWFGDHDKSDKTGLVQFRNNYQLIFFCYNCLLFLSSLHFFSPCPRNAIMNGREWLGLLGLTRNCSLQLVHCEPRSDSLQAATSTQVPSIKKVHCDYSQSKKTFFPSFTGNYCTLQFSMWESENPVYFI